MHALYAIGQNSVLAGYSDYSGGSKNLNSEITPQEIVIPAVSRALRDTDIRQLADSLVRNLEALCIYGRVGFPPACPLRSFTREEESGNDILLGLSVGCKR